MQKICLVHWGLGRAGGGQRVTVELANALDEIGYTVSVISLDYCISTYYVLNDDINLYAIKEKFRIRDVIKPTIFKKIYNIVKKGGFNVILTIGTGSALPMIPALLIKGVKIIVSEHTSYANVCEQGERNKLARYLTARMADKIVYLTKENMILGNKLYNIPLVKQCVIPNFVYDVLRTSSQQAMYNPKSKKIITVGIYDKIKGYDILVKVAKEVLKKYKKWEWHIYGKKVDEKLVKCLEECRKEWDCDNQLFFHSDTQSIFEIYKTAGIYVMTSYNEGFPMALLEAKMFNLPIVSFDCHTGPRELIENGVSGYLVECYNRLEMENKISRLIENEELRKDFSCNARNNLKQFNKKNILNKWKKVIDDVCAL